MRPIDPLRGSNRFTVLRHGVPIGSVMLPDGRDWAGGLLTPLPAFAETGRILDAARENAGRDAVVRTLTLPLGDRLRVDGLSTAARTALDALCALEFELADEAGRRVATDMVRLADPGDGKGTRVYAYFRGATAGHPASRPAASGRPGDAAREQ